MDDIVEFALLKCVFRLQPHAAGWALDRAVVFCRGVLRVAGFAETGWPTVMLCQVNMQKLIDEFCGVVAVNDSGTGFLVTGGKDIRDECRDASGAAEDADQLSFVIGNRQFAECAAAATHDHDDVRGADVDDLATHQAAAGEDQHVVKLGRRMVLVQMLVQAEAG